MHQEQHSQEQERIPPAPELSSGLPGAKHSSSNGPAKSSPGFERAMDLLRSGKGVILFDGDCALCNASVQFILAHEKRPHFYFASLQSEAGSELAARYVKESPVPDSLIVIQEGKANLRSDGALLIGREMRFPLNIGAYFGVFIPRFIRDAGYNLIARNRIDWFGRNESCAIPKSEQKERLIEG